MSDENRGDIVVLDIEDKSVAVDGVPSPDALVEKIVALYRQAYENAFVKLQELQAEFAELTQEYQQLAALNLQLEQRCTELEQQAFDGRRDSSRLEDLVEMFDEQAETLSKTTALRSALEEQVSLQGLEQAKLRETVRKAVDALETVRSAPARKARVLLQGTLQNDDSTQGVMKRQHKKAKLRKKFGPRKKA